MSKRLYFRDYVLPVDAFESFRVRCVKNVRQMSTEGERERERRRLIGMRENSITRIRVIRILNSKLNESNEPSTFKRSKDDGARWLLANLENSENRRQLDIFSNLLNIPRRAEDWLKWKRQIYSERSCTIGVAFLRWIIIFKNALKNQREFKIFSNSLKSIPVEQVYIYKERERKREIKEKPISTLLTLFKTKLYQSCIDS